MPEIKRILVLDDHANLLEILKEVLIYEHFEVQITTCITELTLLAQEHQPDLIILDCHLAGCNGVSLCQEIKLNPLTSHIPVVICSAYLDQQIVHGDYSCDAVIPKPFNMIDLVDTVNSLLPIQEGNRLLF